MMWSLSDNMFLFVCDPSEEREGRSDVSLLYPKNVHLNTFCAVSLSLAPAAASEHRRCIASWVASSSKVMLMVLRQ
jgi:hypothetical protein